MSEIPTKPRDLKLDQGISRHSSEMSVLVSPVLQEKFRHLLAEEQIINGYEEKIRPTSEKSKTQWLISNILLAGGICLLIFFSGRTFWGIVSAKKQAQNKTTFLTQQFPELKYTFKFQNPEIISTLLMMVYQGDTPAKFLNRSNLPSQEIVTAMNKNFRTIVWDQYLDLLREDIVREPWGISYRKLKENANFLINYQKGLLDVREKINHPQAVFLPDFEFTKHGFHVNLSIVDNLWGYVHMEEFEIARALTGMNWNEIKQVSDPYPGVHPYMEQAVESLGNILELAHLMAIQKDLTLRLHATYIRENAFDILQQLVNHPDFKQCHAQKLFYLLSGHLKLWPSDALELRGERLASFYLYEAARNGDFTSIFPHEDQYSLQSIGNPFDIKVTLTQDLIDEDQLYYLQKIQELIDCSHEDYFKQRPVLDRMEQEILNRQIQGKHYMIADFYLFRGIKKIKKYLAVDKERVSEMAIALGLSLRLSIPVEALTDPVDGKSFIIREFDVFESDFPIPIVRVSNAEGNLTFTMPTKLAVVSQY